MLLLFRITALFLNKHVQMDEPIVTVVALSQQKPIVFYETILRYHL